VRSEPLCGESTGAHVGSAHISTSEIVCQVWIMMGAPRGLPPWKDTLGAGKTLRLAAAPRRPCA
jgi:hypothetical protein